MLEISDLLASCEDVTIGARLVRDLPRFLRSPISVNEAQAILHRRLQQRERDFLNLARRAIFPALNSPYRALFRLVGCEYGDLQRLVLGEGLEGTLGSLFERGVFLTVDELKGRRPIIRGSTSIWSGPKQLRNPFSAFHVRGTSGGSRGARTPLPYSLACFRDRAVNTSLTLAVQGGAAWRKAVWGVPGGSIGNLLRFTPFGRPPERWFVQVDPAAAGLHPRYRWSARVLRWVSQAAGVPLPAAEYVPLDQPLPIARWLASTLRAGEVPHLELFASSAVRLCQAAMEAGIDLSGAQLQIIGEPTTSARLAAIRQTGARPASDYGSSEAGGPVGYGCLAPAAPDDNHLFHDLHVLSQPGPSSGIAALPARALLLTSLRLSSPLILLNASSGDQATVARRNCGCPLESLGWTTHLQDIRSFEKLTAGGMTFFDSEVVRVLEEVLPGRFGGGPTDYQLVEQEASDGQPLLRLRVHPRLGALDEAAVVDLFLSGIGSGSGVERVMELAWRQASLLTVERRAPSFTSGGKIQHLHVERAASPPS